MVTVIRALAHTYTQMHTIKCTHPARASAVDSYKVANENIRNNNWICLFQFTAKHSAI